ncbi:MULTISPECIES: hypothetical protein, partial [unclassified Calothrix]|uniref:hypothetical protein n=1 Tax=unclassified Calothrix TaxID=2619626 RepID=UPI001A7E2A0A
SSSVVSIILNALGIIYHLISDSIYLTFFLVDLLNSLITSLGFAFKLIECDRQMLLTSIVEKCDRTFPTCHAFVSFPIL